MISLLLTLFIFVFSFCPSINRLEDHNENTITINENVLQKNSVSDNGYIYIGFNELVSYENYIAFIRNLKNYDYFPMTNITVENFLLGQSARIYLSGYDISIGDVVDGEFNVNTQATSTFEYIEFSYDGSLDYKKYFDVTYRYASQTVTARAIYNYMEGYDSTPVCSYGLIHNGTPNFFPSATVKYNYNQFSSLLSPFATTLNNYDLGYNDGLGYGYQTGYSAGYQEGVNIDSTAATIFNGVLEIGLLPVNFFLSIFNFEVFGINIKGIVSGLLTVAVVIIIVRFLFGGKDNDK